MGFSNSWLAIRATAEEVLLHFKLAPGDKAEDARFPIDGAEISGAHLPQGWYLLFFDAYDHPLAQRKVLRSLPQYWEVVACKVEEHVMASDASLYKGGSLIWSVAHESEKGIYDLVVDGQLPDGFEELKNRTKEEQKREGGSQAEVDLIFDIPVLVAQQICGFRHDRFVFDWGSPDFVELCKA